MTVQLKGQAGDLNYRFDWSDQIPEGVTLSDVTHTVPSPLVLEAESFNAEELYSTLRVSGGVHGRTYQVSALAELSNGEEVPGVFPLRCFNG